MHSPDNHHVLADFLPRINMANQRSRVRRKQRQRRASTPSTPLDQLRTKQAVAAAQAKRQSIKKHKQKAIAKAKAQRSSMLAQAARRARRERWAEIAEETRSIVLGDGKYVEERPAPFVPSAVTQLPQGQVSSSVAPIHHDISAAIILSRQGTVFYPHYSPALASWREERPANTYPSTQIEFTRKSTLTVARQLALARGQLDTSTTDIGVLSFASPKRPGGGYLHGGDEQEETIARLSSLVASLDAPDAKQFYQEHRTFRTTDGSGLQDHSMVYSPGVVVFRRDVDDSAYIDVPPVFGLSRGNDDLGGEFIPPYIINVLSAVPVNAAAVRSKHVILPGEEQLFEGGIRDAMKERMARALRAFELRGDKVLVLGAFGCGSCENKVEMVAEIWAELLVCGETVDDVRLEARFKNSFEKVVFAIPGKLLAPFQRAFGTRELIERVSDAVSVATMDES
ncbi:hypothetical protein PYCCODRAFT_1436330 [Trametes coccinea BRFM310]|uniref:Microbial-type PARG catalytic domain-containing protein n=1 Tax=Trametes coccinea (strain BRFM310) TaxID=1353009 RepID=A0A1Y2IJS6_TRAC3|nr:hypothetical protein PYCCODRAFT_1436330 [Trametes coccinea BRFM310]